MRLVKSSWCFAALLIAHNGCSEALEEPDVEARKGHSGLVLDVGEDGTPGFMLTDIELRPGVTVDLFVNLYGELDAASASKSCQFAVHGGVFAAASWRPYAEALGEGACVLAADMPVRGNSGTPEGALFGELDLFDYVTALERVLDRLNARGIRPRTILGHSMGGTLVQMLQQRLVDDCTSLRERYGIRDAILVASDLPAEVPWLLGDSGDLSGLIEAFAVDEPGLGELFEIPVALWPAFYFTDRNDNVVPGALTPAQIEAGGFNALGEPLRAIHQLNGTGPFTARPSAAAGLFEKGTRLRAIAYEEDIYVQLGESETLYRHLTGDDSSRCFVPVLGPDTVHVLQFSAAERLVDAIAASDDCHD
ncbi:Pimeloyl-ACP methyl ester carboxylesterase [Nannocystis exedens]|uniref:Pimeloyl-ACP methyl ester carboxylesterase n=1 Tax=Nannocystis exedens TaxID=54 RepID=A0A1I2GVG6_9BACT|nr:alpha/beta hydrolase [Nannocystis exedens]PCC74073.1 Alpha/beta hydrolase family protein [Nannocystis exedens]SFF21130.1 Pimeloyl-ACP methyl ester carboxylesterase [Nannocystis exedens]